MTILISKTFPNYRDFIDGVIDASVPLTVLTAVYVTAASILHIL